MRISDWSSDVCSSDLPAQRVRQRHEAALALMHVELQQHDAEGHDDGAVENGRDDRRQHAGLAEGQHEQRDAHVAGVGERSEEHTSELQSLMRISYADFCLKKKKKKKPSR